MLEKDSHEGNQACARDPDERLWRGFIDRDGERVR